MGYALAISGETDDPTRNAIRAFQHRHGLPVDGDPESPDLQAAMKIIDEQISGSFGLQPLDVTTDVWSAGAASSVHAQGTWSPADPPRQTSDIWCYRGPRRCEVTASLLSGTLHAWSQEYEIDRRDADELQAHSDAICVRDALTINRASKAVLLMREPINSETPACRVTRSKWNDVVMRLVDGVAMAESLDMGALRYHRLGPKALEIARDSHRPQREVR